MSEALNRVVREARRHWRAVESARPDWGAVERRLFARIEEEQRSARKVFAADRSRWWWAAAAAVAAALVVGFALKASEPRSLETVQRSASADEAGSLIQIDGEGTVLVNGHPAKAGSGLRLHDVIEARGAQATVARAAKLTFIVERESRAAVTHTRESLVLALAEGAVEAQVEPVANGEALAVDVGPSRVAVHGTHLRVARTGDRVVVDLSEGVMAVGDAPRVGSTLGVLVTAPAHAEFMATDAHGTLRVTHDRSAVRGPAVFSPPAQIRPTVSPAYVPTASRTEAGETAPLAAPSGASTRPEPHPASSLAAAVAPLVAPPDPNAQLTVAAGVRACMSDRLHVDDVTVVVSTTLYVQLQDDGSVRSARFDPPVAPDVNACAAQSIYRVRFTHGGSVTIPISVKN